MLLDDPGSPPLMREGLWLMFGTAFHDGITPAYAGRTTLPLLNIFVSEDHPRLCGKDNYTTVQNKVNAGSPPLMREGLKV